MSKRIDLTNQRFGRWTVLSFDKSKKGKSAHWICKCDCGVERSVCGISLRKGTSLSCGCYKVENSRINNGKFIDETGNRYGKLVVLQQDVELSKDKHRAQWICLCDCGNIITTSSKCLREGKTTSCGCRTRSIGEEKILILLNEHDIKFVEQYNVVINAQNYRYDFALLNENDQPIRLIEFDGIQHFDDQHTHWYKDITATQRRDKLKNDYAISHNIPLIRIPYWEKDKITLEMIMGNQYLINKAPDMEEAQDDAE